MAPKKRRRNKNNKKPRATNQASPVPEPVGDTQATIPPLSRRNTWKKYLIPEPNEDGVVGRTMLDYTITIPPIPARYNMSDPRFMSKFKYPPPPPELSLEAENKIRLECLRKTKIFDSIQIRRPKWIPAKVELIGFTPRGTAIISFVNDRNQIRYANLRDRIAMWFIIMGMKECDTRIDKKDVQKGLIVLAKINESTWIRAKILQVLDKSVVIVGVDEVIIMSLDYEDVFYYTEHLHDCPFQTVECHLSRLEKWERTARLDVIMKRMKEVTSYHGYYYVTKFKAVEKEYFVEIDFPDSVGKDLSLNQCILEQVKKFDPFLDLLVTP